MLPNWQITVLRHYHVNDQNFDRVAKSTLSAFPRTVKGQQRGKQVKFKIGIKKILRSGNFLKLIARLNGAKDCHNRTSKCILLSRKTADQVT